MVYSALDSFLSRSTLPQDRESPVSGTQLRSSLYDRQVDSLRADNYFIVRRTLEWIAKPLNTDITGTGLKVLSDREFKRNISKQIDNGIPVPIVLLRAEAGDIFNLGDANAILKNHQVLAIGYRLHKPKSGKAHWDIDTYDPNYVNYVQTIHTGSRREGTKVDPNGTIYRDDETPDTGGFRALFVSPYKYKRPYWAPAVI
jgi:hypothetical protein